QAGDDVMAVAVALLAVGRGAVVERLPEVLMVCAEGVLEPGGHHADDRHGRAAHLQLLADDVAPPAEAPLPEAVADDDDLRVRVILLAREDAPQLRLRAEHREV